MKRNLLFILVTLMSMMGAQIAANAQDLTLSDVQNSGCMRSTRAKANRDEVMPSIILTKEGSILTVQLFNYEANCGTTGFDVVPSISGGSDGSPLSVSIRVVATGGEEEDCICPYNISFTIHGLETNSFYFSCVGYEGQVDLTEGEPYELWEVTDVIIDGVTYRLNRKKKTATLITGRTVEGKLNIPAEVSHGGQICTVTSIDYFAFTYNTNLTAVSIPGSVTSISVEAFYYCENLKDVYCYAANVPNTANDAFTGIPASATLHVPTGSVDKYKATAPWNGFGNIVAMPIEINDTNFPDENFRNWMLAQSYGQDGVLTDEEIAGITSINVKNKRNIQSLNGIEYFTALTSLECGLNQLTALDLSKNTALTSLYCYCNQLTTLDLSENTALEHLECWENQLTSLNVSMNTALNYLDCRRNQLTSLDVTKNIALTDFDCWENQLTTLNVSQNTELTELNCTDNQLASLDVSQNTALTLLFCSRNQLTTLNVSACTTLEKLRCDENKLSTLEVSGCSELEEILCYCNRIKGEAMDALVEGLPITRSGCGHLPIISLEGEHNVMTKSQVAAARGKGWRPRYKYGSFGTWGWTEYEGSDDATGLASPLKEKGEGAAYDLQGRRLSGKPARGMYIENGKKLLVR